MNPIQWNNVQKYTFELSNALLLLWRGFYIYLRSIIYPMITYHAGGLLAWQRWWSYRFQTLNVNNALIGTPMIESYKMIVANHERFIRRTMWAIESREFMEQLQKWATFITIKSKWLMASLLPPITASYNSTWHRIIKCAIYSLVSVKSSSFLSLWLSPPPRFSICLVDNIVLIEIIMRASLD